MQSLYRSIHLLKYPPVLKSFCTYALLYLYTKPNYFNEYIPVIFQVASLLAALAHLGHIVTYAPGDSLLCRRDTS
ncbi:hypothetical protein EAE92_15960 [Photorhabdus hainanensis]|nr:hypothetical protein [Photorhabdus hainanensis]